MTDSPHDPKSPIEALAPDFRRVYSTEFSYVVHTLRRLGVGRGELDDVAHDVFVAVYKHFADYDPARPLRPWLFGFAYRIASDHRKLARHRHPAEDSASEIADPQKSADQQLEDEEMRRALLAALDAMSFEKRSIVVMHDLEGMSAPEIAKLLDVPLNTAYSRLRLARAEFEKHLLNIVGGNRG